MSATAHSEDNLLECVLNSEKTSVLNRGSSRAQLLASEDSVLYSECSYELVLETERETAVLSVQDNGSDILANNDTTVKLDNVDVTAAGVDHKNGDAPQSVFRSEGQNGRDSMRTQMDSLTTSNMDEAVTLTTSNDPAEKSTNIGGYTSRVIQCKASHQQAEKMHKYSCVCRVIEIAVLTLIVLVLLGVSMIPTAYFINPPLRLISVSY